MVTRRQKKLIFRNLPTDVLDMIMKMYKINLHHRMIMRELTNLMNMPYRYHYKSWLWNFSPCQEVENIMCRNFRSTLLELGFLNDPRDHPYHRGWMKSRNSILRIERRVNYGAGAGAGAGGPGGGGGGL